MSSSAPGRRLARSVVVTAVCHALQFLVLLFTIPFLVRYLGREAFGAFNIVLVLTTYLGLLDLGLGRAVVKFGADALGRQDFDGPTAVFRRAVPMGVVLAIAAGAAMTILMPPLAQRLFDAPYGLAAELELSLRVSGISVAAAVLAQLFAAPLEVAGRFAVVAVVRCATIASSSLIAVGGTMAGLSLPEIFAFIAGKDVIGAAILALCVGNPTAAPRDDRATVATLLRYGLWTVPLLAARCSCPRSTGS